MSAPLATTETAAAIIRIWLDSNFTLPTSMEHLDELRATLQKTRAAERIKPYQAGSLIKRIRKVAENIHPLPRVERSPDASDDFRLAFSEGGKENYLVTGD